MTKVDKLQDIITAANFSLKAYVVAALVTAPIVLVFTDGADSVPTWMEQGFVGGALAAGAFEVVKARS